MQGGLPLNEAGTSRGATDRIGPARRHITTEPPASLMLGSPCGNAEGAIWMQRQRVPNRRMSRRRLTAAFAAVILLEGLAGPVAAAKPTGNGSISACRTGSGDISVTFTWSRFGADGGEVYIGYANMPGVARHQVTFPRATRAGSISAILPGTLDGLDYEVLPVVGAPAVSAAGGVYDRTRDSLLLGPRTGVDAPFAPC